MKKEKEEKRTVGDVAGDEKALAKAETGALIPKDLKEIVDEGYDIVQTGGQTKWVDMNGFVPEGTGQNDPCKGNGRFIEGVLVGMQPIEVLDRRTKELVTRYFYNIQLMKPCPVTYKDEDGSDIEEEAQAGEIVALGERAKLAPLREWATDGGVYQLKIVPHSKIPIDNNQTLWTFNIGRKILRQPNPELVVRNKANVPF